jgi:tRNA (guanine37-N1)-methyltransferase
MHISILTLFPEMFAGPFDHSIIKRAKEKGLVAIDLVNIRAYAKDAYHTVDGRPYGGGAGMILRVDVVDAALKDVLAKNNIATSQTRVILLDPQGTPYTQKKAQTFSKKRHLILICGHYEGVDARVRSLVDEQISMGDFVVTGGEIPAMAIVDSIVRLLPGVLVKKDATVNESFHNNLLEYPQYTKPQDYKNMKVPNVLLSGNHKDIAAWRETQQKTLTFRARPDLLPKTKKH